MLFNGMAGEKVALRRYGGRGRPAESSGRGCRAGEYLGAKHVAVEYAGRL